MAVYTLMPSIVDLVLDANGNPVSGAKIYTYLAGTSTPATTWTSSTGAVANANPIIASSAGRYVAYLLPGSSYKFVVQDSSGASLYTQDGVGSVPAASSSLDVTGVAGEALTAGLAVYLSDGSGSKVAGSWYLADSGNAYSSTLPIIGMVPASIASGASGTIRVAGSVTGLSSLVVGTTYYVGTAGAITATAPANARTVGVADTTSSIVLGAPVAVSPVDNGVCEGRLTLTTAVPVTTADVTGATSIYFTPYAGNRIALYDGASAWSILSFTELTQALGTLTSGLPYDVFAYNNSGVVATEILAWTSTTARATALTLQNGVLVKTGATTRRFLGTFMTTSTTQTEDSFAKRYVWNYRNRVPRPMRVLDATASWPYTTNTWRQARATATNQLAFVVGWAEVALTAFVTAAAINSDATANVCGVGVAIGLDSTTTPHASGINQTTRLILNAQIATVDASLTVYPAVGAHTAVWLETSVANAATTTWYGTGAALLAATTGGGIWGAIDG